MKNYHITILTAVVVSSLVALPAKAQNQDMSHDNAPPALAGATQPQALNPLRASDVIGMEVRDSRDHNAAYVRDMVIDLKDGSIAEVIIGPGALIRTGEKLQALPPTSFTYNTMDKSLSLNIPRDDLRSAPTFEMRHWKEEVGNNAKIAEIYQRFGATPRTYAESDLERASRVLDSAVRNDEGRRLGRAENLVVSFPDGRIDKVIVASGGFLGIDHKLTAFAPDAFHFNPDSGRLILSMTREEVKNAPHFKGSEWGSSMTPGSSVSATVANTPADAPHVLALPEQSARDGMITVAIEQKLSTETGLSGNARNVSVETQDGKVTLRGTVNTPYARQKVGEIAATVVPSDKVDNQILVSSSPLAGNVPH